MTRNRFVLNIERKYSLGIRTTIVGARLLVGKENSESFTFVQFISRRKKWELGKRGVCITLLYAYTDTYTGCSAQSAPSVI